MNDRGEAFDLVVVGSGPGGYVAAIRAAQLGLRTAVVEHGKLGGRCLNEACIPAKALLRSADAVSQLAQAEQFGIRAEFQGIDFAAASGRRDRVIDGLTRGVGGLLKKNKVTVISGTARFAGPSNIAVDGEVIRADAVILAAGSVPRQIPNLPYGGPVIDTAAAWTLQKLPKSMLVVGSGAAGVELASAYARLGTRVCLAEVADRILPAEDAAVSAFVAKEFERDDIEMRTSTSAELVSADGKTATVQLGGDEMAFELVVGAVGRRPDVDALALDVGEIEMDQFGMIRVDRYLRTSAPRVWAIGDLVPGPALAHKSSEEGIRAAEDVAGQSVEPLDHATIPRATFCRPPVASLGLTEQEAKDSHPSVLVGSVPYSSVGAAAVLGVSGLIKIIGDGNTGEILGAHLVGPSAPDMLAELVMTKALEGGIPEIATTIHGHPTLPEAISEAARAAEGWVIHG